jgi:hypothetical protein
LPADENFHFFQKNADDMFGLFTFEIYFPVVVAQLLLSCFADDYPERFENWTKVRITHCSALDTVVGGYPYTLISAIAWLCLKYTLPPLLS